MGFQALGASLVGRSRDVSLLSSLVTHVSEGAGAAVWVEGEPGIGKSSLVATALADAEQRGCFVHWASADEFSVRAPLRVMLSCLDVDTTSPDPRYSSIARQLHDVPASDELTSADPVLSVMEALLSLVDELCGVQATILVVDDIQWADESSLITWHRLMQAVEQLPLLLIAISRPTPLRPAVARLRNRLRVGGKVVRVTPLTEGEVALLVENLLGTTPGPHLLRLAGRASGNPLYIKELVTALLTERLIADEGGQAELVAGAADGIAPSLASLLHHRLVPFAPPALEMLGTAALLGPEFTVPDLAAVLQTPASALLTGLRQALAAGLITDTGTALTFRHPLIRHVLHDGLPSALRPVLGRQIARVLAETGAAPERVAEQLLATPAPTDRPTFNWIAENAPTLVYRVPNLAAELLARVVDEGVGTGSQQHNTILLGLAKAYFRIGQYESAEKRAWEVLGRVSEMETSAEVRWTLTRILYSAGRAEQAGAAIEQALLDPTLSLKWQARFTALFAMHQRSETGDLIAADRGAQQALNLAESCGDRFALGYALCVKWLVDSVRRDHASALESIDKALHVLDEQAEQEDLRSWVLENKVFTLHNLDRLHDAETACRAAVGHAQRSSGSSPGPHLGSAVHDFWCGRWDDALASLSAIDAHSPEVTHFGLRERGPTLLYYGVSALIASHRDERTTVQKYLQLGLQQPLNTISDWENYDFLVAAQALEAERRGSLHKAVELLSTLLEVRPGQMTLVHQWLPALVRLALETGDMATADAAFAVCLTETEKEKTPARAAAATRHCRGLLQKDPGLLLATADYYAKVGRSFERAQALEDAAVMLASQHHRHDARAALIEAASIYTNLGAFWDVRRADTRIRPHGIRRGARGPRPRRSIGWESLTPTELKVARLVAQGKSNPQVAADLFLSRRTVQTHVSHILVKLRVRSRVEIATEALQHPEGLPTSTD
ncbi:helix-turn-helix transcriptional regulator [Streptomyces collinus]|uniref:helix-turn-helix transcriptional regulator n=1 Tax=Streptomyces collinus TaxID=42684 RepID=UPI0036748B30